MIHDCKAIRASLQDYVQYRNELNDPFFEDDPVYVPEDLSAFGRRPFEVIAAFETHLHECSDCSLIFTGIRYADNLYTEQSLERVHDRLFPEEKLSLRGLARRVADAIKEFL